MADGEIRQQVLFRHNGRQTSRTFPTIAGAERFAQLVDLLGPDGALHQLGQVDRTDVPTVATHVNTYVNSLSGITDGTRSDYLSYVRRDMDPLATIPIDALTREAVARWVNTLATRLSGKSIKNRHSLLSAAMTRAAADGMIADNPCRGVRLPRSIRREMTFLTHGEFAQLLGEVSAYWRPLVTTMVGTGVRWGEATALAVKDVDLDVAAPTIRIRQAWKHTDGKGHQLGPPKTSRGRRTITLPPEAVSELVPLLETPRKRADGTFSRPAPDDFVFVNRQGRPVHQSTFLVHVWQPAVRALAVDQLVDREWVKGPGKRPRVHDLRHTHASWLIAAGIPLTFIQYRLGHESIQTTSDLYGHLMPEAGTVSAAATSLALALAFPHIDDDGPASPNALSITGHVADVEGGDDTTAVR